MKSMEIKTHSNLNRRIIQRNSSNTSNSSSSSDTDGDEQEELSKKEKYQHKPVSLKSVGIRAVVASVLACLFLAVIQAGHFYCILFGVLTQFELYRELVNVRYTEGKRTPAFRTLQWSWFLVAMFSVYGETLHSFFSEHPHLFHLTTITQHLTTIVFVLYCVLFAASVLTLRKNSLRFQISQYMWSVAIICLIVFQCKFFATNALNGLFWFFFPFATVACNDVSAYFAGITFGRRFIHMPFLSISPNKTWEGFIGGAVCTLIFSFLFPLVLAQWTWFTCPAEDLYIFPPAFHSPPLECTPHVVFTQSISVHVPYTHFNISVLPIQIHGIFFGLFAAIVAPFGGFFASAIKRAYKRKDFDSFIPGHGGLMDRMDCQLLMVAFTSFYYSYYISHTPSLARLEFLASSLSQENQRKLLHYLELQLMKNKQ